MYFVQFSAKFDIFTVLWNDDNSPKGKFNFLSFYHTKPFNSTFKHKMASTSTTITTTSTVEEDAFAILHNINESLLSIYILEM